MEVDLDLFFTLRQLLNYKKIGRLKRNWSKFKVTGAENE
nr:MAG TPA: hypothetical protein [Caudoviricetes sp.]